MKLAAYIALFFVILSCGNSVQEKNPFADDFRKYRNERNSNMSGENSPLPSNERKNFVGLNFFDANEAFVVKAKYEAMFGQPVFEMQTTTDRKPKYKAAGILRFTIKNQPCSLLAYQNMEQGGNELFVPFTDGTTGALTYETGRYLDIEIPDSDSIQIDFNRCYNPYCAYNKKYSCPIPPKENRLQVSILAGEKKYH